MMTRVICAIFFGFVIGVNGTLIFASIFLHLALNPIYFIAVAIGVVGCIFVVSAH